MVLFATVLSLAYILGTAGDREGVHVEPQKMVVSTDELEVSFGPIVAVGPATIDIGRGVVGLLGPNGAGKQRCCGAWRQRSDLVAGG